MGGSAVAEPLFCFVVEGCFCWGFLGNACFGVVLLW
jgi:hypothetical protein